MTKRISQGTAAFIFALTARAIVALAATNPNAPYSNSPDANVPNFDDPHPVIQVSPDKLKQLTPDELKRYQSPQAGPDICVTQPDQDHYIHDQMLVIRKGAQIGIRFKKDIDAAMHQAADKSHYQDDPAVTADFLPLWNKYSGGNVAPCPSEIIGRADYYRLVKPSVPTN